MQSPSALTGKPDAGSKPGGMRRIIAAVLLVVFVVAYYLVLSGFLAEGENRATPFTIGDPAQHADYVNIDAKLMSVDPAKGEASIRLQFTPHGAFDKGGNVAQDLKLSVNGSTGNVERAFAKGKPMNPTDVTVDLVGVFTNFPFDQHSAALALNMSTVDKDPAQETLVPVVLNFSGSLHGLTVMPGKDPESEDLYPVLDVGVTRATSTVFFAVFIIVVMWLLALGSLYLTVLVLQGRKVELAMFSFLASLLFAFPAIRNVLPGTPPLGALNDFIAFFWTESIVAICLLTLIGTWIMRPQK
ncbi:MAG: DUF4436 family protein [Anaerolineae bacterium]